MKFQHLQLKSFANSKGPRHKKYGGRGGDPMGSLIQESWIFFILPHESRCTHYSYKCLVLLWVSHHMISYQTMGYDRNWESLLAQLLISAAAQAIFAFDHLHHIFIIAISSLGLMSSTFSGQPLLAIRISAASINVTVNLRKPTMKLLMFILTITTFPLVSTATSMESLLRAQIMAARCEARCNMEENNLERREAMQCREVCSLLLSTSSTSSSSSFSLCSSPLLCARGCQTACKPPPPPAPAFFLDPLSLSPCSITWHLSTSQPAIFLLGAEDAGGKLHLVATTSASFLPRIHLAASYTSLQLLAVTSTGVVARSQLLLDGEEVEEEVKCNEEEPVQQSTAEPQQHITFNFDLKLRNVLSFALPGCLGVVLLCLLILLLFRRLRSSQDLDQVESQVEEMRRRRRSQEVEVKVDVEEVVEVNEVCPSHRSLPLLHPQMEPLTSIPKKFDTNSPSSPLDHFYEEIGKPYAFTRVASFVRK